MNMNGQGLDLATFINSALDRNGGSSGWGNGDGGFLWILLVLLLGGGRWGGFGGSNGDVDSAVSKARADGLSDQVVIDAVRGNATAISQLATTLNCDINAIQTVLCGMDKSIMQVGNQVGLTSNQIINAIQSGNCQITQAIAQCCCDMKALSYETQIKTMEQTNALTGVMNAGFNQLGNKIDAQTLAMNQGFQNLKDYLTNEKIETLQHTVTQMENAANNANQTLAFRAAIDAATAPIQSQVTALVNRVPPNPVPAYPAAQYATGYAFGVIPTNNCVTNWNCGCNPYGA